MTVLYAEDDPEDFDFFCEVAKELDSSIVIVNASNGLEALRWLETTSELPDFIFLDINMPATDGRSCLKSIKRNSKLKSIRTIMFTTSGSERDRKHCLQQGAEEYICKPYSIVEAKETLSRFFGAKARKS